MSPDTEEQVVFTCRECETRIFVDTEIRDRLLEVGTCLTCGATVTEAEFERCE